MAWSTHTDIGYDGSIHVWPEHDDDEHDIDLSFDLGLCWCSPGLTSLGVNDAGVQVVLVSHRDHLDRLELDVE